MPAIADLQSCCVISHQPQHIDTTNCEDQTIVSSDIGLYVLTHSSMYELRWTHSEITAVDCQTTTQKLGRPVTQSGLLHAVIADAVSRALPGC